MNNTWHPIDLYSTLINDDIRPPPPFAIPLDEAQGIEWIQSLTIISVVAITLLICAALLQIHIHDHCWHDFTKIQLRHSSALLLFILFFIALLSFYLNSIVIIYMVLTLSKKRSTFADFSVFCHIFNILQSLCMEPSWDWISDYWDICRMERHFVYWIGPRNRFWKECYHRRQDQEKKESLWIHCREQYYGNCWFWGKDIIIGETAQIPEELSG